MMKLIKKESQLKTPLIAKPMSKKEIDSISTTLLNGATDKEVPIIISRSVSSDVD